MPTNVTFNGTTYAVPDAGGYNWQSLSAFLLDVGQNAGLRTIDQNAIRVASTSPVTVSSTTDYAIVTDLDAPGPVAVSLPAGVNGQVFVVLDGKGDAATNNITITPSGAETINGAATLVLAQNRQSVVLQYSDTGTQWRVLGSYFATLANALANPMTTEGDIIYGSADGLPTRLGDAVSGGKIQGAAVNPDFGAQSVTTSGSALVGGITSAAPAAKLHVSDAYDVTVAPSTNSTLVVSDTDGSCGFGLICNDTADAFFEFRDQGGRRAHILAGLDDSLSVRVGSSQTARATFAPSGTTVYGKLEVTGDIVGRTSQYAPAAGMVGEYVTYSHPTNVSTSVGGTPVTIHSWTLQAGVWMINAHYSILTLTTSAVTVGTVSLSGLQLVVGVPGDVLQCTASTFTQTMTGVQSAYANHSIARVITLGSAQTIRLELICNRSADQALARVYSNNSHVTGGVSMGAITTCVRIA